jgi:metal iron transporter
VLSVLICIAIIITKVDVDWSDAFEGFLPSKTLFAEGGLYTCELSNDGQQNSIVNITFCSAVGILGATVMPHSLFLGSALATQDRISPKPHKMLLHFPPGSEASLKEKPVPLLRRLFQRAGNYIASVFRVRRETEDLVKPKHHADRENNTLAFVQAHLYHGIFDMAISLLGFAVIINSLCVYLRALVCRTQFSSCTLFQDIDTCFRSVLLWFCKDIRSSRTV